MKTPRYGQMIRLSGASFEDAKQRTVAALAKQGFGILWEIDVKSVLKAKLGVDFRKYVILGACNPQLAHQGLEAEQALGLLLPCNVCVWEDDAGAAVAALRPDVMVELTENAALEPIAADANSRIGRAFAEVNAR